MRISSKGRYALVAVTGMAQKYESGEYTTVISISERFGISKIYLEQVFSLLKRAGLVISIKGAQGGYQLSRPPAEINTYEVLAAAELSLFESSEETVSEKAPDIEKAIQSAVFGPLDEAVRAQLENIKLSTLVNEAEKNRSDDEFMFFI